MKSMVKIKVKLFANFREAAGVREVEVEAENLGEVFEYLSSRFPGLKSLFFDSEGNLKDYVNVMISGKLIRGDDRLRAEVKAGDSVSIFPPVSGG